MDFWDNAGKEQVELVHLLVCVQNQHFLNPRWDLQIFCCSKTEKDIDLDIQATYRYANVDA